MANLDELHESAAAHRHTQAFRALRDYNLALIEKYRDRLEAGGTQEEMIKLRGRLKECREQLKIVSE